MSPYKKHAKKPHQYSAEYRAWRQNPTPANDYAWRVKWGLDGRLVDAEPRTPRGQRFPAGVEPFNPHTKPVAKPFWLAAA